jgi:hypothetical protein
MCIKNRYLVPKTTGIAGISTSTSASNQLLVVYTGTKYQKNDYFQLFGTSTSEQSRQECRFLLKVPVTGKHTDE